MNSLIKGALDGLTVIDLSRVRAGPSAVRPLADWGANVIKIETPLGYAKGEDFGGSRHGSDFQNLQRNKRSLTLNLKSSDGIDILKRLIKDADVVVENFRPDVKTKLAIDYVSMEKINPRLIYASISGFGQSGPYSSLPGFDQIAQGMGGLMSVTGIQGQGPVRAGIPVADLSAGLYCALGIMIALFERQKSGKGQWVSVSLLEAQIAMLDFQAARYLMEKEVAGQAGNDHPTMTPMGAFKTADGYINIASAGDAMWKRLCKALNVEKLMKDSDFKDDNSRVKNRDKLNKLLTKTLTKENSEVWIKKLNIAGVPCGPIYLRSFNFLLNFLNDRSLIYSSSTGSSSISKGSTSASASTDSTPVPIAPGEATLTSSKPEASCTASNSSPAFSQSFATDCLLASNA